MDPRYATAIAAAAAAGANTLGGSPNGGDATMAHLQNLAGLQFDAGSSSHGQAALTGDAGAVAAQQDAARKAQAAIDDNNAKISDIQKKAAYELVNPANYRREVSSDGGYDYYDAKGNKISVQDYSKATGKQIPDALSGSQNPNDQQFVDDYKRLMQYGHAVAGDQAALDSFSKSPAGKEFLSNPANANKTYAEVVADFKNHYSGYLQPNQTNAMPTADSTGRDVRSDIVGGTQAGWLSDFLNGQRQNVTYR